MKRKPKSPWEIFNIAFSLGTSVLASLLVGIFLGYYIDKLLNTSPVFLIAGIALGIWVGFRDIFRILR
jgi:ATP synthase protein I